MEVLESPPEDHGEVVWVQGRGEDLPGHVDAQPVVDVECLGDEREVHAETRDDQRGDDGGTAGHGPGILHENALRHLRCYRVKPGSRSALTGRGTPASASP